MEIDLREEVSWTREIIVFNTELLERERHTLNGRTRIRSDFCEALAMSNIRACCLVSIIRFTNTANAVCDFGDAH